MKISVRGLKMTNLFKCYTCDKTVTSEESKSHKCEPVITRYVTIEASSFFTTENEKGEDCLAIDAFNGTGYNIIIKKPNLMPLAEGLPCDLEHPKLNTEKNNDKHPASDQNSLTQNLNL